MVECCSLVGAAAGAIAIERRAGRCVVGECDDVFAPEFNARESEVRLRFYGPVTQFSNATAPPVTIQYFSCGCGCAWTSPMDMTAWFEVTNRCDNGTFSRDIVLKRAVGAADLAPGRYRVTPVLTGGNALLCDNLGSALSDTTPKVADFVYDFWIMDNCFDFLPPTHEDYEPSPDCEDIAAHPWLDFNRDGRIGICAGDPCIADVNGEDAIDDLDVTGFFAFFEAGNLAADLDNSGSINDLDTSVFFLLFARGC